MDGSFRGDQLRVLLNRLPQGLQRVALSATVHDPQALAERYVGDDATIVDVGEPRALDLQLVYEPEDAIKRCREAKRHKVLWFCNTRRQVETMATELARFWPKNRIVAHHGSLSARERRSVETAMQQWPWGLCVATMTLEIGIDIGDVTAVVLHGPPLVPSAFQQRIGRACRREPSIFAIGLCEGEDDPATFETLGELAATGTVEETEATGDASVALQQILSVLFAAPRGVPVARVAAIVAPLADEHTVDLLLEHLIDEEWVEPWRDQVKPATKLMDSGEKGHIHSNIPDTREFTFKDAASGRVIGTALTRINIGDTVVLGGQVRRVVGIQKSSVQLARGGDAAAAAPSFRARPSGGAWRWLLPEALR